jgi:hypothetical protein
MAKRSGERTSESVNPDVEYILTNAPRLMKVAAATAISFALWHGVNRALLEIENDSDRREIAAGYRGDCAFNLVTRLSLLLDRNSRQVSFQTLYHKLKSETVVAPLLKKLDEDEISTSRTVELANDAVQLFSAHLPLDRLARSARQTCPF